MPKLKEFSVTYRCEVKMVVTVLAKDEKEARSKFDHGDTEDDIEIDCIDIDNICINEKE